MIDIAWNTSTNVARLALTTTIKPGGDVPVRITFATAPGSVSGLKFTLGTDAAPPAILAYTEDFSEEDEEGTIWTATLDANDSRLIAFLVGKQNASINGEVTGVIDAELLITPNIPLTVQQRILAGPGDGDGGPTWYTKTEVDALLAALPTAAASYQAATVSTAGDTASTQASLAHFAKFTLDAGSDAYTRTFSLPTAGRAAGDCANLHLSFAASTNPLGEIRNATSGGTLLFSWQGDGTATEIAVRCVFTGTAWELHDAHFVA